MLKNDFLINARQDLTTHPNKEVLNAVIFIMEEVLKDYPFETNIDEQKTAEGAYQELEKFAKEHQKNNSYCVTTKESKEIIIKYLELEKIKPQKISLEDFL